MTFTDFALLSWIASEACSRIDPVQRESQLKIERLLSEIRLQDLERIRRGEKPIILPEPALPLILGGILRAVRRLAGAFLFCSALICALILSGIASENLMAAGCLAAAGFIGIRFMTRRRQAQQEKRSAFSKFCLFFFIHCLVIIFFISLALLNKA